MRQSKNGMEGSEGKVRIRITGFGQRKVHLTTPVQPDFVLLTFFSMILEAAEVIDNGRFKF